MKLRATAIRILALGLASAASPIAAAPESGIDGEGVRFVAFAGEAAVDDARSPASLRLLCRPGADGAIGWSMTVREPSALSAFRFADFDGPEAPAREQKLATASVRGGAVAPELDVALNGLVQPDGAFAFAFGAPAVGASTPALLADAIDDKASRLVIVVSQIDEDAPLLRGEFALDSAAAVTRETMLGCGPAPRLTSEMLAGWERDATPLAEVLADRAIAWRLGGASGAAWPDVRARLALAPGLVVDGTRGYALAEGAGERDGAALLVAAGSDAAEVVLIDGGIIRRYASGQAAVDPPAAVREFVAARIGSE